MTCAAAASKQCLENVTSCDSSIEMPERVSVRYRADIADRAHYYGWPSTLHKCSLG